MDRLSSLMARFRMVVDLVEPRHANLVVHGDGEAGLTRLVFFPDTPADAPGPEACLALRAEWSGAHNPLVAALPERGGGAAGSGVRAESDSGSDPAGG